MAIADTRDFVALLDDIVEECEDDHVGLWSILSDVRRAMKQLSPDELKGVTLDLLRLLLAHHLVEAGFPAANGRDFDAWTLAPDEAIDRIRREWAALGRDPTGGEIAWFTAPAGAARHVQ